MKNPIKHDEINASGNKSQSKTKIQIHDQIAIIKTKRQLCKLVNQKKLTDPCPFKQSKTLRLGAPEVVRTSGVASSEQRPTYDRLPRDIRS